jgi:hypothetical protein
MSGINLDPIKQGLASALIGMQNAGKGVVQIAKATPHALIKKVQCVGRSTSYMLSSSPANLEKTVKLIDCVAPIAGYNVSSYSKVVIDTICARNLADAYFKFKEGFKSDAEKVKVSFLAVAGACESGKWLQTYAKVDLAGIAASIGETRLMTAVGGKAVISYMLQYSLTVTKNTFVIAASTISVGQGVYSIYQEGFIKEGKLNYKVILEIAANSLKIGVIILSGGAGALFVVYAIDVTSRAFKVAVVALNSLGYIKAVYEADENDFKPKEKKPVVLAELRAYIN